MIAMPVVRFVPASFEGVPCDLTPQPIMAFKELVPDHARYMAWKASLAQPVRAAARVRKSSRAV